MELSALVGRVARTTGLRLGALALSSVTMILAARWLGPQGRGEVAAINSWFFLLCAFGSLSLGQAAVHRAANTRGRAWIAETLGGLLAAAAALTALGWLLSALSSLLPSGGPLAGLGLVPCLLGAAMLPLLLVDQYLSALLPAADILPSYNRALLVSRAVGLSAAALAIVVLHLGIGGALAAALAAQLVLVGLSLHALHQRREGPLRAQWSSLRPLLEAGLRLHIGTLGLSWVTTINILLLQRFHGPTQTGFFSLANDLSSVPLLLAQAVSAELVARVGSDGADAALASGRKLLPWLCAVSLVAIAVGQLIVPQLVPLLLGNDYAGAGAPLNLLLWSLLLQVPIAVMSPQWVSRGLFVAGSLAMLAATLLNALLALWWIPAQGAFGAALASLTAQVLLAVINLALLIRLTVGRSTAA